MVQKDGRRRGQRLSEVPGMTCCFRRTGQSRHGSPRENPFKEIGGFRRVFSQKPPHRVRAKLPERKLVLALEPCRKLRKLALELLGNLGGVSALFQSRDKVL